MNTCIIGDGSKPEMASSQTASLFFLTVLMQSVLVLVVTFICPMSILENFERLLDPCKNV